MSGSLEVQQFLSRQDDSMGRRSKAPQSGGVPSQRSGAEPSKISEEQVRNARLAVARSAQNSDDCRLLLDMLGLTPDSNGIPPVRE